MLDYEIWHQPLAVDLAPSTLDVFDPFDVLDQSMCRNLFWINQPTFLRETIGPIAPKVPHKYRIKVDCHGYNPKSIKTEISPCGSKLIVTAKEGEVKKSEEEDFSVKEFRRVYKLANNLEIDKMVSFVTGDSHLVVEFPIKDNLTANSAAENLFPMVSEVNGEKRVTMNFDMPDNIDPSKIRVTCKDRDVIVQAEDKVEKSDGVSQFYFYRRCTLPENTDFDVLKCTLENNKMMIEAPCNAVPKRSNRTIAIENKQKLRIQNH